MFSTSIGIRRMLAVINGFVAIPDGEEFLRTKLTPIDVLYLIPGSVLVRMGARGSSNVEEMVISDPTSLVLNGTGRMQERLFIRLPEHDRMDGPSSDWYALLRENAELA